MTLKLDHKIELLLAELDHSKCNIEHLEHRMDAKLFTPRLRKKYLAGRAKVSSIDDFIEIIASRSSVTQTSYMYICSDTGKRELGGFLHEVAARYKKQHWKPPLEDN